MDVQQSREAQLVLLIDDDINVTDVLAAGLERDGRTVITCNDIESAELIVERMTPSHVVSDVRLSGPLAFEGLDFIRYVKRYSPESRIILMIDDAAERLQMEASERGAVAFLQKPFAVDELDSILDLMTSSAISARSVDVSLIRMPLMDEILAGTSLRPFFQPIVSLTEGHKPYGYESLARYRENMLLRDPIVLFQYAERKKRVADLEVRCAAATLQAGLLLAQECFLFLNIHPGTFSDANALYRQLERSCIDCGVRPDRLVLEITEQQATLNGGKRVLENIKRLRELGVRFAFDDVGDAYAHLSWIEKVRPAFLKISQRFGTSFEADAAKSKIVANIVSLAHSFDCEVVLEGIEHAETAAAAARMGIGYGQGFFFARPGEAETFSC
jgi:EAL domain-containing protein (putative c-di-GMP-specific phosphodiesterase class I)